MNSRSTRWTMTLSCIFASAVFFPVLPQKASKGGIVKPTSSSETKADTSVKTAAIAPATVKLAPQTTCPVMGGKIDKKFYVDYKGKRIYACCGMCPPEIRKDPEKYIKKLESMGQGVETIEPAMTEKTQSDKKGLATPNSAKKDMPMEPAKEDPHKGHEHHQH